MAKLLRAEKQAISRAVSKALRANGKGPEGTRAERRRTWIDNSFKDIPKISGGLGISLQEESRLEMLRGAGTEKLRIFMEGLFNRKRKEDKGENDKSN